MLKTDPVEGIFAELPDDSNLYEWKIYMEGPRDTAYSSGVFQLMMKFPQDYPMSPPELRFTSSFWHPNVYPDGKVCISILHPPVDDPMSGELPEERWLPTQTVVTILLSVISLLNAPNLSSPANVDASIEWRKDQKGYNHRVSQLVQKANKEKPMHIKVPHPDTDPEERKQRLAKLKESEKAEDLYYDDDDYDDGGADDYDYDDDAGDNDMEGGDEVDDDEDGDK